MAGCVFQKTRTIFQVPRTTSSRCRVMSLPFEPKQTFLTAQGNMGKLIIFIMGEVWAQKWVVLARVEIPLGCVVEWEDSGDSFLFNDFALSPDCKKKNNNKKKHNIFPVGESCEGKAKSMNATQRERHLIFRRQMIKVACLIFLEYSRLV